MDDARIRALLLNSLYSRRHNAGGWVPITEADLAPNPIPLAVIFSVCGQLADVGLIEWRPLKSMEGVVDATARITGRGVSAVERKSANEIEIRFFEIEASLQKAERPTFPRQLIISAAAVLKGLGHSGLKSLLLELGIVDGVLQAEGGGLMAKTTALAEYALKEPKPATPEGATVASSIVLRAAEFWRSGSLQNLNAGERENFEAIVRQAGHSELLASTSSIRSETSEVQTVATSDIGSSIVGKPTTRKIFLVHGHDGEPRESIARFLTQLKFLPIILHEQTNQGRTIIEKFEKHADVNFAVIILTPDDVGGVRGDVPSSRARQNVILEWGYFIGRLGRDRVCALKKGEIELPSDILGIVWEKFDEEGAWKMKLARELDDAGFEIDWRLLSRA